MFRPADRQMPSAGGPRHALAEFLRRLAGRLEPAPPEPPQNLVPMSRAELREVQAMGLQMIIDFAWISRERGPAEGLIWFPHDVLRTISWMVTDELEMRDRDFATIEKDPLMVWS